MHQQLLPCLSIYRGDTMSDRKPYDSAYKYLFSSTVVFHQFITRFVDEEFVQHIALEDIEQIGSSFPLV